MKVDEFATRMKAYEGVESQRILMPLLPAVARLDGITFHSFTKWLQRPYDERLSRLMVEVATVLLKDFGAQAAYTQSDEITLGWYIDDYDTEMFCGGRIQKLNSHLASRASVRFNRLLADYLPEKVGTEPTFDCRIFNVPNQTEAANQFLWREQDATKNSISMAARAYYHHKEIDHKNGPEMQEMLFQKGVNWNDYPNFFKRGTFIIKTKACVPFTAEEIERLPEKHAARTNPELRVERNQYVVHTNLPKFSTVRNREEFIFRGANPEYETKPRAADGP